MADQDRPRGRAETWWPHAAPGSTAGAKTIGAWPTGLSNVTRNVARRIREWLLLETVAGRLVPWLAIGFGLGIVLYFSIDQEPATWAAVAVMLASAGIALMLRRRPIGFPAAVGFAVVAWGFGCATIKCSLIAHPVLTAPVWNVGIAGFVEMREERERSDRITLRVERLAGTRFDEKLERVRLAVRKGTAPRVGSFVELNARLLLRWDRCAQAATISPGTCISTASGRQGLCLDAFALRNPRHLRRSRCATPLSSTQCAKQSTSEFVRPYQAIGVRSPRR
jgi:uncharacterized protein DUF4131